MHGFINSNYAGITGSLINPTSILNSKLYLDIAPFGLHLNVDNNYIYLARDEYKFSRFFTPGAKFPEHGEDNRAFYDKYDAELKYAYTDVRVMGPAAMLAIKDQAFGFSTSFRTLLSGNTVPFEIGKFAVEGLNYSPLHRINFTNNQSFRVAGMAFTEISATYSRVIYKHNREHWTAGINLKGLLGTAGMYGYVDNIDYMVPNGDTLIVYNMNGEMGLSMPVDYYTNEVLIPGQLFRGSGIGVDLGVTYQKKMLGYSNKGYSMNCEYPFEPYRYRLGLSLLDFGRIKFRNDARYMEIVDRSAYWKGLSRDTFENLDELIKSASFEFSGDSNALIKANTMSIWLPAALSFQADIRITKTTYLNYTIVQPLIMSKGEIVRPPQLSLTPRWESNYLEFAVPFILYAYKYPRLGMSVRFRNLVVGTDKLGGFFGFSDFYGLDLYILLKISLFKGDCGNWEKKVGCRNLEYKQKY